MRYILLSDLERVVLICLLLKQIQMQKKTLKIHMTCTYNFTIWYEIAESYDISFKCSQWNWILKAHSFVNEFKLELNYSSIVYYSRNKQSSANL